MCWSWTCSCNKKEKMDCRCCITNNFALIPIHHCSLHFRLHSAVLCLLTHFPSQMCLSSWSGTYFSLSRYSIMKQNTGWMVAEEKNVTRSKLKVVFPLWRNVHVRQIHSWGKKNGYCGLKGTSDQEWWLDWSPGNKEYKGHIFPNRQYECSNTS